MRRARALVAALTAVAVAGAAGAALGLRSDPAREVLGVAATAAPQDAASPQSGASPQSAGSPQSTFKWPRQAPLPPVQDATGLEGDNLVRAKQIRLPGADASGAAQLVVRSGGYDRPYLLAPARRVAPRADPALLVVLPAANTNLRTEYDRYGLDAFRDHGLTVLVAGTYAASWNAGACCGRPRTDRVDDVAAVAAMRSDAVRRSGADAGRTALVGHSVGALMAWRLACTPAFGAVSVVAVSGTLVHGCPPSPGTVRFLSLSGADDRTVPVDGSRSVVTVLGIAPPSVRRSLATLAQAGGCAGPTTGRVGTSTVTEHVPCRGGGRVRLQVVAGVGHPWAELDATRRAAAWLAGTVAGVR